MSERVVCRILCSKRKSPHVVGRVLATSEGFLVRFTCAVRGLDGFTPAGSTFEYRPSDTIAGMNAWCPSCRIKMPISPDSVLADANRGLRVVVLQGDGMFLDPLGVLERSRARAQR